MFFEWEKLGKLMSWNAKGKEKFFYCEKIVFLMQILNVTAFKFQLIDNITDI